MDPDLILPLFYKFFLALSLGALIGIEREKKQQLHRGTDFAGIRTFMLFSFLGAGAAYLSSIYYDWLLAVTFVCFFILILVGYIFSSVYNKDIGMTTELSAIVVFIIGVLSFKTSQEIPILLTIITTLVLSFKTTLHRFVHNIKNVEYVDTIKFLLIAFVILPLLKPIPPIGPLNLYEVWLMVVFISALSYVAYILIKIFGSSKGTVITGLLGGILSSTAVVTTLANKSKEQPNNVTPLVVASGIACAAMFIRIIIEVFIIEASLLNFHIISKLAFPMILLALVGNIAVSILWKRKEHGNTKLKFKSPLMLIPAIKFGIFYGSILILAHVFRELIGPKGLLVAALFSGLADVDAITVFVAMNSPDLNIGIMAIILAAVVNTIIKLLIGKLYGAPNFGRQLAKVLVPIIIAGILIMFLI